MERMMRMPTLLLLILVALVFATTMGSAAAVRSSTTKQRGIRGNKNNSQKQRRELHPHVKSAKSEKSQSGKNKSAKKATESGRVGQGFFTGGTSWKNPKHGEPGHVHGWKRGDPIPSSAYTAGSNSIISNSIGVTSQTSQLATYADKCDAAQAGAEFHTSSYVPMYYQYEMLTSPTRNALDVADIVDKAVQHFLAIWLVDCDTTSVAETPPIATTATSATTGATSRTVNVNGNTRRLMQEHVYSKLSNDQQPRNLQLTLEPIVGTGVGEWDIVLLGDTAVDKCTSELGTLAITSTDLVCYKVIGSTYVYLDTTMTVTPKDIESIALETLTVGMNLASTDFTELDPDIYDLHLVSGYDSPPEALIETNRASNTRSWDDGFSKSSIESQPQPTSQGRSGGAKFGIAFAILACIALIAFMIVYFWKNRDDLWEGTGRRRYGSKQRQHHNLDDVTLPTTRFDPSTKAPEEEEERPNITIRSLANLGRGRRERDGGSPSSTSTRPLSPEPVTPRHQSRYDEDNILVQESNIVSPRSDAGGDARSTISDVTDMPEHCYGEKTPTTPAVPSQLIRLQKLSQQALRESRHSSRSNRPSQLASPDRAYEFKDTVAL